MGDSVEAGNNNKIFHLHMMELSPYDFRPYGDDAFPYASSGCDLLPCGA